jgi:hypothetical protein
MDLTVQCLGFGNSLRVDTKKVRDTVCFLNTLFISVWQWMLGIELILGILQRFKALKQALADETPATVTDFAGSNQLVWCRGWASWPSRLRQSSTALLICSSRESFSACK